MAPNLSQILGTAVVPVAYKPPQTFHLPNWGNINDAERIAVLRRIVLTYGRDPRIAELAQRILVQAGAQPRDYRGQAAAFLRYVQGLYYRNEPGERLQAPDYTIKIGGGDCDDLAILLGALLECVRMPWRFVLSGVGKDKQQVRWVEGEPLIRGVQWSHIYIAVGDKPFTPTSWTFAEPTLKGAPLGWDVVSARSQALPEMATAGLAGPLLADTPSPIRHDIRDPALDLRDAVKELLLLEDHLAFPNRRCPDCIRKHLLKVEALAEEAVQLDVRNEWAHIAGTLAQAAQRISVVYERRLAPPQAIAQAVRDLRKSLVATLGPAPLNGLAGAAEAGGQVAASLSERDTSSDSLEFFGVNWKQVGVAVLAGVAVSVSTQVVLDKLGYRHGSSRSS